LIGKNNQIISFAGYTEEEKFEIGKPDEVKTTISDIVPLVEKKGFLLTPHDVKTEQYKEEHGEYPKESYM